MINFDVVIFGSNKLIIGFGSDFPIAKVWLFCNFSNFLIFNGSCNLLVYTLVYLLAFAKLYAILALTYCRFFSFPFSNREYGLIS